MSKIDEEELLSSLQNALSVTWYWWRTI